MQETMETERRTIAGFRGCDTEMECGGDENGNDRNQE
jgi:hypothetical protein